MTSQPHRPITVQRLSMQHSPISENTALAPHHLLNARATMAAVPRRCRYLGVGSALAEQCLDLTDLARTELCHDLRRHLEHHLAAAGRLPLGQPLRHGLWPQRGLRIDMRTDMCTDVRSVCGEPPCLSLSRS